MTKKYIFISLAVFIAIVAGALYFFIQRRTLAKEEYKVFSGDAIIKMEEDNYTPQNFEVKKGAKVKFLNESDGLRWPASDLHPSHLIFPEFDPKEPIEKGESWTMEFNKVGEWGYHDHLAPYITGIIKVTE